MYSDRWIAFDADAIRVRGYYFPWGTKRIPYSAIRSVQQVKVGALTGRMRIWGTGNPRLWASLDPGRPRKSIGFIVDAGKAVSPFLTPRDPKAFAAELRARLGDAVIVPGGPTFI